MMSMLLMSSRCQPQLPHVHEGLRVCLVGRRVDVLALVVGEVLTRRLGAALAPVAPLPVVPLLLLLLRPAVAARGVVRCFGSPCDRPSLSSFLPLRTMWRFSWSVRGICS